MRKREREKLDKAVEYDKKATQKFLDAWAKEDRKEFKKWRKEMRRLDKYEF